MATPIEIGHRDWRKKITVSSAGSVVRRKRYAGRGTPALGPERRPQTCSSRKVPVLAAYTLTYRRRIQGPSTGMVQTSPPHIRHRPCFPFNMIMYTSAVLLTMLPTHALRPVILASQYQGRGNRAGGVGRSETLTPPRTKRGRCSEGGEGRIKGEEARVVAVLVRLPLLLRNRGTDRGGAREGWKGMSLG